MGDEQPAGPDRQRVVALLAEEWSTLLELLGGLSDEDWGRPALPGWDVHDVVAHLTGAELMLTGEARPEVPEGDVGGDHVRNDIARMNEAWIVTLRRRSHAQLLDELRTVLATRRRALESMSDDEWQAPSWTPTGPGTYGRFMEVRVFDFWMHEQDIRAAVDRPGHDGGPVAEAALGEVVGALGYIVGKRGRAPDGATVTISLTGPVVRDLHVEVDGRARVVDTLNAPATTTLSMASTLFMRLAGGRVDAATVLDRIRFGGDGDLGRRLAANLAYTI